MTCFRCNIWVLSLRLQLHWLQGVGLFSTSMD
uniref:Uncharacterized protein n=1 Tax=Anguilla anguilla TaxID=7936 RepID=A0A0E9UVE2_ANGAN